LEEEGAATAVPGIALTDPDRKKLRLGDLKKSLAPVEPGGGSTWPAAFDALPAGDGAFNAIRLCDRVLRCQFSV
jgi:hypothetical protein